MEADRPEASHQHADSELSQSCSHEPAASLRGRLFLWGGLALGLLLAIVLITDGFGLFGSGKGATAGAAAFVHQGARIFVPEHSALRQQLTVTPAAVKDSSALLVVPGEVEADPARSVAILPAGGGRVHELAVALGDRVTRGQLLARIDSPDLAQAYDDYDKAASVASLATVNRKRQEEQLAIGAASQREVDQAQSDEAQALAEIMRARPRQRPSPADACAPRSRAALLPWRHSPER